MDAEEEFEAIRRDLETIRDRNARVEADKAWETSPIRIVAVGAVTYLVASFVFFVIGTDHIFRNALVPTVGYLLSVQSLPLLKRRFMKRYIDRISER